MPSDFFRKAARACLLCALVSVFFACSNDETTVRDVNVLYFKDSIGVYSFVVYFSYADKNEFSSQVTVVTEDGKYKWSSECVNLVRSDMKYQLSGRFVMPSADLNGTNCDVTISFRDVERKDSFVIGIPDKVVSAQGDVAAAAVSEEESLQEAESAAESESGTPPESKPDETPADWERAELHMNPGLVYSARFLAGSDNTVDFVLDKIPDADDKIYFASIQGKGKTTVTAITRRSTRVGIPNGTECLIGVQASEYPDLFYISDTFDYR